MMNKKNDDEKPITRYQLKKIENRITKMSGFSQALTSIKRNIDKLFINDRMFENELKTLHKRIDNLQEKMKKY